MNNFKLLLNYFLFKRKIIKFYFFNKLEGVTTTSSGALQLKVQLFNILKNKFDFVLKEKKRFIPSH